MAIGEKAYDDNTINGATIFSRNPYQWRVMSPYGYARTVGWGVAQPQPGAHARFIHQTISLNNSLNHEAQTSVDSREPKNIWEDGLDKAMAATRLVDKPGEKRDAVSDKKRHTAAPPTVIHGDKPKPSRLSSFRKAVGLKSSEERTVAKDEKAVAAGMQLRDDIVAEEQSRWPDEPWREVVSTYLDKVGMTAMVAELRADKPLQYLHLLRAGYFEPIPVAVSSRWRIH